jgi:hypothetical protein
MQTQVHSQGHNFAQAFSLSLCFLYLYKSLVTAAFESSLCKGYTHWRWQVKKILGATLTLLPWKQIFLQAQ